MRAAPIRREIPARSAPAAPDPTTPPRPYHARHPSGDLVRLLRQSGADHAVAGNEVRKPLLAPAVGAGRAHRQHEIANFRGRIPDANIGALGQLKTEIPQDAAWILHRLGAIGRGLVPDRRQSEHRPWIAGPQCAHDHVVESGRVFDGYDVLALTSGIAELRYRRRGVFEQT